MILVCVLGPDFTLAAERIAARCNNALCHSAGDPVFLLGDFNKCDVSRILPDLEQYITFNTRLNKFLDQCFGSLKDAYVSRSRPPLGRSDQNIIHLFGTYWQLLKKTKPTVQLCQVWTEEAVEELKGCFEAIEWGLFFSDQECQHTSELLNDTITSYISYITWHGLLVRTSFCSTEEQTKADHQSGQQNHLTTKLQDSFIASSTRIAIHFSCHHQAARVRKKLCRNSFKPTSITILNSTLPKNNFHFM